MTRHILTGPQTRRNFFAALAASLAPASLRGNSYGFERMLWEYTLDQIERLDRMRRERLAALESQEDLKKFQEEVRSKLKTMWGGLPGKTPLKARRAGRIERADYTIEKLIYESRPNFPVTANLYLPAESGGPMPAVGFIPGFASNGKAYRAYQRFAILLARHGFVVLVWDPIGRGERLQLWDPRTQASRVKMAPEETLLGRQSHLVGLNLMQYRVWDALRAADYLASRPEVDAGRIALAGEGAGGIDAVQAAAFEPRIAAVVAADAVSSFRAAAEAGMLSAPGPVLYETLKLAVDHQEMISALAPRPLVVGAQKLGKIPVTATRQAFAEAVRSYEIYQARHKALLAASEEEGLGREVRESAADWLLRWLTETSREVRERPAELASDEELQCTPRGQVAELREAETVWSLNSALAEKKRPGYTMPRDREEFTIFQARVANTVRAKTRVGRFRQEPGIHVPERRFEVGAFNRGVVIVISPESSDSPGLRRRVIDPVVAAGYQVISLDLRGWGRSIPHLQPARPGFWEEYFSNRGLEMGRPLLGQRMRDLLASAPERTQRVEWIVAGVGEAALVALHAAVIEPRISRLVTVDGLLSYRSLAQNPLTTQPFSCYIPGVVDAYEIRDLYAALAPRPVLALNPRSSLGQTVHEVKAWEELDPVSQVYEAMGSPLGFTLKSQVDVRGMRQVITNWLKT